MGYSKNQLKYAECDFCSQKRACFVQHQSGEEQVVCPECLCVADLD